MTGSDIPWGSVLKDTGKIISYTSNKIDDDTGAEIASWVGIGVQVLAIIVTVALAFMVAPAAA